MTSTERIWMWGPVGLLLALSFIAFCIVLSGSFASCQPGEFSEHQHKTISSLDAITDLSLKLSTALVGFGAAALMGFKSDVKLSGTSRVLVACATICFAQSALYAAWWRFGLAEVYFNRCFGLIATNYIHWRFEAHIYAFMLGLAFVGLLVLTMLTKPREQKYDT